MRPATLIGLLSACALTCAALSSCSTSRVESPLPDSPSPLPDSPAGEGEEPEAADDAVPLSGEGEDPPVAGGGAEAADDAQPRETHGTAPAMSASVDTGGGKPRASDDGPEVTHQGGLLRALSRAEAPSPTRTFLWGKATLNAPGFYIPPSSTLTIALDDDNRLRYLSVGDFSALPKTFGDGEKEFPLSGMKHVDLNPDIGQILDCTVDPASMSTPTHFLFRMRAEGSIGGVPAITDYVESLEGHAQDGGWSVVYTEKGKLYGAQIDARGEALLHTGDPQANAPAPGQAGVWSAPVELVAPGFYGTPVDHLKVALDGNGQLRSFAFHNFPRKQQLFGTSRGGFPLVGSANVGELRVTVDQAIEPTPDHFVVRYRVEGQLNDYVEGLEGTRQGDKLIVRYFIKGKLWSSAIDAHAAGTLAPSSEAE